MESEYKIKDDTVLVARCKDYPSFWAEMKNHPCVKKMHLQFGTMPDCSAFCELANLEELRLLYLKKLSDISGIAALKKTLKHLWFETGAGKTIADWSPLAQLTELEELVISNNAVISDLHFLEPLKKLKNLRLVGVKITAEDLSPLKNIPEVAFYHTGADKRLNAFLSENQTEFMTNVKNRVQELGKELKEKIEKEDSNERI